MATHGIKFFIPPPCFELIPKTKILHNTLKLRRLRRNFTRNLLLVYRVLFVFSPSPRIRCCTYCLERMIRGESKIHKRNFSWNFALPPHLKSFKMFLASFRLQFQSAFLKLYYVNEQPSVSSYWRVARVHLICPDKQFLLFMYKYRLNVANMLLDTVTLGEKALA